tara:strand:+ start:100 stop:855 length:756 start_codon:yes stop_codon:yes gene_type:complete
MVLPKDTSAVKVYVSVAIASGMIHSGLIFELDKNNKNYQTCSLITNSSFVENEITPKFFLVHLLNDGVDFEAGHSVKDLEAILASVWGVQAGTQLPPCFSFPVSTRPVTNWIAPLVEGINANERKTFEVNASNTANQSNCTLLVLDILRRLGAGDVVDLSRATVLKLLKAKINTNVIQEQELKNVAKKWSKLWSQFCVKPSMKFANGIREEMKQLLGLFTLPPPVPTTSADGNRITFTNNSRPRKKRRQSP